jgi:alpha-D-xyloside xylohydrolase
VKDGGIIPMMKPTTRAPKAGVKVDVEIRHYGTLPSRYMLYDDDGETFNYEKGDYSWREIKVEKKSDGSFTGFISEAVKGKPNSVGNVTWKFMTTARP